MVVNEIDIDRLAIAEPEGDAQVAPDAYAPVVGKGALKRVHAVARNVEVGHGRPSGIGPARDPAAGASGSFPATPTAPVRDVRDRIPPISARFATSRPIREPIADRAETRPRIARPHSRTRTSKRGQSWTRRKRITTRSRALKLPTAFEGGRVATADAWRLYT